MGLSRRQFTKEFKLAAVRRLEQGVSIGEAARALEVNPNVLQRWRREFRHGPGNAFPGMGSRAGRKAGLRSWSARLASRRWRSIFCGGACSASRNSGCCRH
jgi:transposase-like protein